MGQVIIGTQNPDAARHEQRAMQDRAEGRADQNEAQRRAAVGDYRGAAAADREARRDFNDARRQENRASQDSRTVILSR